MFVYSKNISLFLERIRNYVRNIFIYEMCISFGRSRFLYKNYYYSLNIAVFEKKGVLGYFDFHPKTLALNKSLLYLAKKEIIKNIIRHELAHLMVYLEYSGENYQAHGAHFKAICTKYGWQSDSIVRAKMDIEEENNRLEGDLPSEKIIGKIKKLLSLASSSNSNEAELATLKANQLLLRYNLEDLEIQGTGDKDEDIEIYMHRVLTYKRINGKMQAIMKILNNFLVSPVYSYFQGGVYLEVSGKKVNVELAQYVASYLDRQLEVLWEEKRKENPFFRGIRRKNSFMLGVAEGYEEKVNSSKELFKKEEQLALATIHDDLRANLKTIYGRLGSVNSKALNCHISNNAGQIEGKNLEINPGISREEQKTHLLN